MRKASVLTLESGRLTRDVFIQADYRQCPYTGRPSPSVTQGHGRARASAPAYNTDQEEMTPTPGVKTLTLNQNITSGTCEVPTKGGAVVIPTAVKKRPRASSPMGLSAIS